MLKSPRQKKGVGAQSMRPFMSKDRCWPTLPVRVHFGTVVPIWRRGRGRLQSAAAWVHLAAVLHLHPIWVHLVAILGLHSARVDLATVLVPHMSQEAPELSENVHQVGAGDRAASRLGVPERIRQGGGGREDRGQQQDEGHARQARHVSSFRGERSGAASLAARSPSNPKGAWNREQSSPEKPRDEA